MSKDFYQILDVDRSASAAEIKKAYLKLAKKYHPDQNKDDPDAEVKFKEISSAYDVLKDEQKKAAYDRFGHDTFTAGGSGGGAGFGSGGFGDGGGGFRSNADFNDIFGNFFSDFMGGGAQGQRRGASSQVKGSDLTTKIEISLEEAYKGTQKELKYSANATCSPCSGKGSKDPSSVNTCDTCKGTGATRMQQGFFAIEQTCQKCKGVGQVIKNPCSSCHGSGRVQKQKKLIINIPAGSEDGMRIRHTGEGEAGIRGGSSGDLYVFIAVKPHDIFHVEGVNLRIKLPISITKAALGGAVKVPTIEGGQTEIKIPAGSQTGDVLRLSGKGMSAVRSSVRGDMLAQVFVVIPKNLTKKQKDLLQELEQELGESSHSYNNDSGFFSKMKNLW